VHTTEHHGVPVYFLRAVPFFGEEKGVYNDRDSDIGRFIFFSQASITAAEFIRERLAWFPDVVHVHDWHTGLVPFLIHNLRPHDPSWARMGVVLSIHNLAYQGDHVGGWLWEQGISGREGHTELRERGLTDNLMAIAIAYSDLVSTVSPRYAVEIQFPYAGYGLDGLIRTRVTDLYGILNGIDQTEWDPATDRNLVANYDSVSFRAQRVINKRQLQRESGLQERDDIPVIGLVSRLVWQKGIDLIIPAMREILEQREVQFIALGSGEPQYNNDLLQLGLEYPWKAHIFIGYNAAVAQHIYGGCDLFLMPSHYEPCGVGQMIAMRYGALPLVRETGGLADTVTNYDDGEGERGVGFTFQWETPEALAGTLRWALDTYRDRPEAWARMQERAMRTDLSWGRSADEYIELYATSVKRHRTL
jgi:starch synthase